MNNGDYFNELSTSSEGINTPPDLQDSAPTDMIEEVVETIMDDIQAAFDPERADHR